MMIKVFTTDKKDQITLTTKELKELLDEAYWEGYRANNKTYTYTTPSWTPWTVTYCGTNATLTCNSTDHTTVNADDINIATSGTVGQTISSDSLEVHY